MNQVEYNVKSVNKTKQPHSTSIDHVNLKASSRNSKLAEDWGCLAAGPCHWIAAVQNKEVMTDAVGASGLWTTASLAAKHPSLYPPCRAWLAGLYASSIYQNLTYIALRMRMTSRACGASLRTAYSHVPAPTVCLFWMRVEVC